MAPRHSLARKQRTHRILSLAVAGLAATLLAIPVSAASIPWNDAWHPGWLPSDPPIEAMGRGILAAPWETARPVQPGLLVALDPVTRRPIRPSAAQREAFSQAFGFASGRTDLPLPVVRLPGGGESVHLPEGFQVFVIARRNADGTITLDCVNDPDDLPKGTTHPRATSQPPVER